MSDDKTPNCPNDFDALIRAAKCARCEGDKEQRFGILCHACMDNMPNTWPEPLCTLKESLERLRAVFGDAFDNVDPDQYVRELRGEE